MNISSGCVPFPFGFLCSHWRETFLSHDVRVHVLLAVFFVVYGVRPYIAVVADFVELTVRLPMLHLQGEPVDLAEDRCKLFGNLLC